jgi:hypothetical protein
MASDGSHDASEDVVISVTRNPKRSVRGRAMDEFVLRWFIEGENNLKRG